MARPHHSRRLLRPLPMRHLLLACLAALLAGAAKAQVDMPEARADSDGSRWHWQPETLLRWPLGPASLQLGWRSDREPALPGLAPIGSGGTARVGLGFAAGPAMRLSVDTPLWADARTRFGGRPLRFGLAITPADPWAGLSRGQLTRIELSADRQLALRARGGGLALTYSQRY